MRLSSYVSVCILVVFLMGCIPRVINTPLPIRVQDPGISARYKIPDTVGNRTVFKDPQLEQLLVVALQDNLTMQQAANRVRKARELVYKARSLFWPSVDLSGSVAEDHFHFQGKVPAPMNEFLFNQANISNAALQFNYELDLWGKNRALFAIRLNESFAAKMDAAQTRLLIGALVSTAFFDLQNNVAQLQLATENVRIASELEAIVFDRSQRGVESDIPVKTAITTTQSAKLTLENYKGAVQQSIHQLAILMGKNPFNTQIDITPFRYNAKQLTLPAVVPANLLGQRPDIIATRARAQAAAHQIKVAKTAFYPNINLSGVLSVQSLYFTRLFHIAFETEGAKAALELPIFDAGARKANLNVAFAEFDLAVNTYNQTILHALQETADEIVLLNTLQKQINSQTKAFNAARQNYRLFQARYQHGIIDYVQLLEIKQVVIQQEALLKTLQTRQKQAFVHFLAATGKEVLT